MKTREIRTMAFLLLLLGGSAWPGQPAWALTDEEIFREFRFNFINPGARAAGLGGAFIAAADDAAAAGVNPAALHYLNQIEFFAEYRWVQAEPQLFQSQTGSLQPTLDLPFVQLQSLSEREDRDFVSFVSVVVPFNIGRKRASVAPSRQVLLDEQVLLARELNTLRFSVANFPQFINEQGQLEQYSIRNTVMGQLDTELVYYNLAFSFEITQDFSVGLTATYATLDMKSQVDNTLVDSRGLLDTVNPREDPDGTGMLANVVQRTTIDGTDTDFTYSVGLHWHPDTVFPSGKSPVRFGAVYRKGAELSVEQKILEAPNAAAPTFSDTGQFANTIRVPDRYGIGMSYHTPLRWVVALDVERINYSDMLEGFRSGVNFFTSDTIPSGALERSEGQQVTFDVDDATVYRVGAEYSLISPGNWVTSIRAGYYNAPDNRIRMTSFDSTNPDINRAYVDAFRGGEDDDHYTIGFSIGTPAGFRIDVAGDFADLRDELVASMIYRFGRPRR